MIRSPLIETLASLLPSMMRSDVTRGFINVSASSRTCMRVYMRRCAPVLYLIEHDAEKGNYRSKGQATRNHGFDEQLGVLATYR